MTIHQDSQSNGVSNGTRDDLGRSNKQRPYLLIFATAATGHAYPMIRIGEELIIRGFEATFVTGEEFAPQIKRIGAEHITIPPMLDVKLAQQILDTPPGIEHLIFCTRELFTKPIPRLFRSAMAALEHVHAQRPDQEIVVLHEALFVGLLPMAHGAPLPKGFDNPPRVINVNVVPLLVPSIDTGPFGPGLPPDSTASGRARNALLNQLWYDGIMGHAPGELNSVMREVGATRDVARHLFHVMLESFDVTLQMCSPSLEYPRSDLHPTIKFPGCVPAKEVNPAHVYPEWWSDISNKAAGKKVVGVAQGTIAVNYSDLIIPTIRALGNREDVLLVAILGVKGATLPADFDIPANTRVVDFLPYDALLRHADVWVTNAGYGGFLHGVMNGVPMVLAGQTEDKTEVSKRGEWAGVAVNLKTARPTEKQIAEGVQTVLADERFKKRVMEIKKENEELRPLDTIERYIWEYAESK